MLENCWEPTAYIVCTHEKYKKSIILRLRERIGAGKTLLKMKIKSKSQMNGSYPFEAVAGFLSINYLALSSSSLNL